jgi:hypothetical protein
MRALESTTYETEGESAIAALIMGLAALFRRLAMLSGFSVQDPAMLDPDRDVAPVDADLCIADVTLHPWPGLQAGPAVCEEIVSEMLELLEEHPESCCVGIPSPALFIDPRRLVAE